MSEEEFFNRAINRICKDYDYNFANEFKLLFLKKEEEIERLNNIINELLKIIVQCKDEINITTYKDMNNCEKWETKLSGYLDILNKSKDIIGSDKE